MKYRIVLMPKYFNNHINNIFWETYILRKDGFQLMKDDYIFKIK